MIVRVPHFYDAFSCTGSACPDTCCVGWLIEIDDDACERFMKMEGEFGERVRNNIVIREDGRFFALNQEGRCAFLNEDNLCEMVIKAGEKSLCSLCDNYPRVGVDFGALRELCLSMSCPEVARLILSSRDSICFGEWNKEEKPSGEDYTRDAVFEMLLKARDVLFGILQNRKLSIGDRAVLHVMYAAQIQHVIDEEEPHKILEIAELFSEETYIKKCLSSVKARDTESSKCFVEEVFSFMGGLENINEKWILLLEQTAGRLKDQSAEAFIKAHQDFAVYYKEQEYVFEHLMVYYVYRYFMKMVFDGDLYAKAVMCAVTVVCIREMDITDWLYNNGEFSPERQIGIFYLYSKEIEHCEENLAALYDEFWDKEQYQPGNLIENITKIL